MHTPLLLFLPILILHASHYFPVPCSMTTVVVSGPNKIRNITGTAGPSQQAMAQPEHNTHLHINCILQPNALILLRELLRRIRLDLDDDAHTIFIYFNLPQVTTNHGV